MPNTYVDADQYVYDEITDEFVLIDDTNQELLETNGNRVLVSQPNNDGLRRYSLLVDDFGYITAALVRLFRRLGLKV